MSVGTCAVCDERINQPGNGRRWSHKRTGSPFSDCRGEHLATPQEEEPWDVQSAPMANRRHAETSTPAEATR